MIVVLINKSYRSGFRKYSPTQLFKRVSILFNFVDFKPNKFTFLQKKSLTENIQLKKPKKYSKIICFASISKLEYPENQNIKYIFIISKYFNIYNLNLFKMKVTI